MADVKELALAESRLAKQDPVLGRLIELQKPMSFEPPSGYFFSLCRSIIGQQISVAAAAAVFGRFQDATKMDPAIIVRLSDDEMREIGLSRQKISYIRDLAQHFLENPKIYNHLNKLSDEEVIADLIKIKGIGVWSAQMFLMFTLNRLDVFAPDDIGLQRALRNLYGWDKLPSKEEINRKVEVWRPYRTVACWHLWHSLHNEPA